MNRRQTLSAGFLFILVIVQCVTAVSAKTTFEKERKEVKALQALIESGNQQKIIQALTPISIRWEKSALLGDRSSRALAIDSYAALSNAYGATGEWRQAKLASYKAFNLAQTKFTTEKLLLKGNVYYTEVRNTSLYFVGDSLTTHVLSQALVRQPMSNEAIANLRRMKRFCVSIGKDGLLEKNTFCAGTPSEIDLLAKNIERVHSQWIKQGKTKKRRIVIFAHGGLTSEKKGLENATQHIDWWLENGIYPIYLIWHSSFPDIVNDRYGFTLPEPQNADFALIPPERTTEILLSPLTSVWTSMKEKCLQACIPAEIDWNKIDDNKKEIPAASALLSRLHKYSDSERVDLHLVGHSAGSIFCAGMLERLDLSGDHTKSLNFLAPAIRIGEFQRFVGNHVSGYKELNIFNLSDKLELADSCKLTGLGYPHSLLYLVSRSFEPKMAGDNIDFDGEVPLLGMTKFANRGMSLSSISLLDFLKNNRGKLIVSPSTHSKTEQCNARRHGGFADDVSTMNSLARIILEKTNVSSFGNYRHSSSN